MIFQKTFILILGAMSGIVAAAAEVPAQSAIPGSGFALLPTMSDRAFWNNCVNAKLRNQIIAHGEAALTAPPPQLPGRELYTEYSRNGNRANYEKAYNQYLNVIDRLAMGACFSGDVKYVARLEKMLPALCALPSWLLPAHDVGHVNLKGQGVTIDLVSSRVGWNLALLRQLFRREFKAETIAMLDRELEKRIVAPFERMVDGRQNQHWLRSKNNWSIVCLANVAGVLLAADIAPERRWRLLDATIDNSKYFLAGYGTDGYCSEGMSYWRYGFGHYLMLSLALHKASDGKINLMSRPQARLAGDYPEKIRISDILFPAFSDCELSEKLPAAWLGVRDYLTGKPSPYRKAITIYSRPTPSEAALLLRLPPQSAAVQAVRTALPPFSEFPDAGIFVIRPAPGENLRLSAAVKGGSNDEFHNHNDVGSFVLGVDGAVPIAVDPGAEHYNGRSFSAKRYESKLNNSFGHSVPRIDGQLQSTGKNTRSKVVKKVIAADHTEIVFDIRPAYRQIGGIAKLERTFRYDRTADGVFTVSDAMKFNAPKKFESALITFGKWRELAPGKLLLSYRGKNVEVTIDSGGVPFKVSSEEIRENIRWQENPQRIAITLLKPVKEATLSMTFRAGKE